MNWKVVVVREGIVHYLAACRACSWTASDHSERQMVRDMVYAHIRKTGHCVTVEKAVVTHYEAVKVEESAE